VPYRRTILLVEDDPDLRELTAAALRDEGYRVVAVARHAEALAQLRAFRFGLVLADSEGMVADPWAGLEALLRAAGPTPVVIYSAHRPEVFADHAARGFAGLLVKPFDLDELLATVRAHLPAPGGGDATGAHFLTA
jgi:DNA-binding response OmpR family regulator